MSGHAARGPARRLSRVLSGWQRVLVVADLLAVAACLALAWAIAATLSIDGHPNPLSWHAVMLIVLFFGALPLLLVAIAAGLARALVARGHSLAGTVVLAFPLTLAPAYLVAVMQ